MPKEKAKGSPRQRYGLWLFFGLLIGIVGAFIVFLGLFEPRRDMIFAETSQIPANSSTYFAGYSTDEQTIYTQSTDGHFRIWDASTSEISSLQQYDKQFINLQWNPEKTHFLGIEDQRSALLFDKLGNRVTAYEHAGVYMVLWNPTGTRVITLSETESKLWTVDAHLLKEFSQPIGLYDTALWSPDGRRFVTWDAINIAFYDADGNQLSTRPIAGYPTSYAWNSTGSAFGMSLFVVESSQYRVGVYDADGLRLWEHNVEAEAPQVVWNPDGSRLTAFNYSSQTTAILYSMEGERLAELDSANIYLWHPDGEILLTGTAGGRDMRLLDKNGELIRVLSHESDTSYSAPQWSPNGDYLATWDRKPEENIYTLYLWDKAGNLLHEMSESTPIDFVVWSPDSSRILSVGSFVARIWSVEGGEINSLNHNQPIMMARWNSDGSRILTMGAYMSWVEYENAIWTSEGEHLATVFTGDSSYVYVSEWRDDFSQVLLMTPNGISVRSLQAGNIYFDFRFDN